MMQSAALSRSPPDLSSRSKNSADQLSSPVMIQKRAVSFGNPALGTYHGHVFTTTSQVSIPPLAIDQEGVSSAYHYRRFIAMVNVPPAQVPEGILHVMAPFSSWIVHVRIVIEDQVVVESSSSKPLFQKKPSSSSIVEGPGKGSIIDLSESSKDNRLSFPTTDGQYSADRSYLVLIEFVDEETATSFVQDLHDAPYTSLDDSILCSVCHVVALEGINGVSVMSPLFAATTATTTAATNNDCSTTTTTTTSASPNAKPQTTFEDYNCAVCLEHMDLVPPTSTDCDDTTLSFLNTKQLSSSVRTSILTTVCNHSFHMSCLEQWQDSPCPVCRYDHSGLNQALSRCHECGTTNNNYVCLICGVISCADESGDESSSSSSTTHYHYSCSRTTETAIGVPPSVRSHAQHHYNDTLHAYALHTVSQHVWDFAGQGYVHRLLQNKEDRKLVEVNDPLNTSSQERSTTPGLSDAQESEVVHRKLEGFASQYYTLLKSQLEQQRIYFEGQLEEIRREHNTIHSNQERQSLKTAAELMTALKAEQAQLSHRLDTLKARNSKVAEDLSFIINLNEGLEANREPLRQQIQQAQRKQLEQRQMLESCLPPLQEKVTRLMLQLETGTTSFDDDRKPSAIG